METTTRDHTAANAGYRPATLPDETRFWEQSRAAVLIALVQADTVGCREAIRERRIVAWLNQSVANLDASTIGLPVPAVRAAAFDFTLLSEADPEAAGFYRRCDTLFANAETPCLTNPRPT